MSKGEVIRRVKRTEEPTSGKPVEEAKPILPDSDIVTVKVLFGTVSFRDGTFEAGETFKTTRKQASEFEQRFIQIV